MGEVPIRNVEPPQDQDVVDICNADTDTEANYSAGGESSVDPLTHVPAVPSNVRQDENEYEIGISKIYHHAIRCTVLLL